MVIVLTHHKQTNQSCFYNLMAVLTFKISLQVCRLQRQDVPNLALGASYGGEVCAQLGGVQAALALTREVFGLL